MAYVTHSTAPSLFTRLGGVIEALATRYQKYRMFRATYDELSALTNRELADLGIDRSSIGGVAREAAGY